jgi:hypothetical protein
MFDWAEFEVHSQSIRCSMTDTTASLDPKRITSHRVMPPLGLARVGNCTAEDNFAHDYLITTEVVGGLPTRPDGAPAQSLEDYRGPDSAIRRHASRFRVYATLDDGTVTEIRVGAAVEIEWRVALANLKAGWYQFLQAMDLPDGIAKPAPRRNPNVSAASGKRSGLDIRPRPVTISGASLKGTQFQFDDGTFRGQPVYLAELRTDADGRLLVLGGRGLSASYPPNTALTTFANNDDWHDDVADGPVRASVRFPDGTTIDAEPGYVVVTPPNFAPGLVGLVTMDDAVRETFIAAGGWRGRPPPHSRATFGPSSSGAGAAAGLRYQALQNRKRRRRQASAAPASRRSEVRIPSAPPGSRRVLA